MRRLPSNYAVAATIAAFLLVGCSNATTGSPPVADQQNQASKRKSSSCPCLYVTNWFAQAVSAYPLGASGNATPLLYIAGAATKIDVPYDVALDGSGNIYVSNYDDNSITLYPAGSTGNVSPTAIIIGSNTEMLDPGGIGVDPVNGTIYVTSYNGPSGDPSILGFPAGSNGNVAPTQVIEGSKTGLQDPTGLAVDASGNIYVSDDNSYINVYAADATGNVAPTRTIEGRRTKLSTPLGVSLDSNANVYVANGGNNSVTVYAAGANGNVAPIQIIAGHKTKLTNLHGVVADSSGNLYASNAGEPRSCPACSFVAVYATGATGAAAPVHVIKGTKTGLDGPSGLAIH
jgi:6-phosphogluconolactonase (cycloisomerase 2 family)